MSRIAGIEPSVRVLGMVEEIEGWATDTVAVDFIDERGSRRKTHTVLCFVPGNPGCIGWYSLMLKTLVTRLGVGFAARGISYAAHGITGEMVNVEGYLRLKNTAVPWTVDGQIQHKLSWIDEVVADFGNEVKFVMISHSIGSHMIQRMLLLRKSILRRTTCCLHLMPFVRMDAPHPNQSVLSSASIRPKLMISIGKSFLHLSRILPYKWMDRIMKDSTPDDKGRELALNLMSHPAFARNFFELGCEEIRDVPEQPDETALRYLLGFTDLHILFVEGPDHWAPRFHMDDIVALKDQYRIPQNVYCTYIEGMKHDFIVFPSQVPIAVDFCLHAIRKSQSVKSRL